MDEKRIAPDWKGREPRQGLEMRSAFAIVAHKLDSVKPDALLEQVIHCNSLAAAAHERGDIQARWRLSRAARIAGDRWWATRLIQ